MPDHIDLAPWILAEPIDGLKFSECLPTGLGREVVSARLADRESLVAALTEPVAGFS